MTSTTTIQIAQLTIGLDSDNERTQLITEDGQHVAYIEQDPHEEIALTIMQAVNSHGRLVGVLAEVQAYLHEESCEHDQDQPDIRHCLNCKVNAALAAAEGRE